MANLERQKTATERSITGKKRVTLLLPLDPDDPPPTLLDADGDEAATLPWSACMDLYLPTRWKIVHNNGFLWSGRV